LPLSSSFCAPSSVRIPFDPSVDLGVGHKPETQLPGPRAIIEGLVWFALAVGVCNNPEPLSDVRGANRASW
jgi:hypothetical protein